VRAKKPHPGFIVLPVYQHAEISQSANDPYSILQRLCNPGRKLHPLPRATFTRFVCMLHIYMYKITCTCTCICTCTLHVNVFYKCSFCRIANLMETCEFCVLRWALLVTMSVHHTIYSTDSQMEKWTWLQKNYPISLFTWPLILRG
jgi:hypothetical protein